MILETPKLISISFVAEEEKVTLYASPTESSSGQKAKRELMLRPHFPGYYRESDLPDLNTISEVIVAVADVWRVGDLVDWFFSGCFWSGTITDIIDDKRAKVLLPAHLLKYFSLQVSWLRWLQHTNLIMMVTQWNIWFGPVSRVGFLM